MAIDSSLAQALRDQLFGGNQEVSVYAVLDGAINPDLLPALSRMSPRYECLWLGALEPELQEVAPYLVEILPDSSFARYLIDEGYGQRWGIFAWSHAGLRDMRAHFRRFTLPRFETGEMRYFRFYDPACFPALLDTADADQLAQIFGPVEAYLYEEPAVFWEQDSDRRFHIRHRPMELPPLVAKGQFRIRDDQRPAFAAQVRRHSVAVLVPDILLDLSEENPDALVGYDEHVARQKIRETVQDCLEKEIVEYLQIYDLCLINLIGDINVLTMEAFADVMDEPLMHPHAKARHIILAFDAIRTQMEGGNG